MCSNLCNDFVERYMEDISYSQTIRLSIVMEFHDVFKKDKIRSSIIK